jgi:hypothetical protein
MLSQFLARVQMVEGADGAGLAGAPKDLSTKALDGGMLVGKDFEDRKELGDLKEIVNFFCQVQELQFAAAAFDRGVAADELSDARAINIIHIGQVQQDEHALIFQQLANGFAEKGASLAQGDTPANVYDSHGAGIARSGL